MGAFVKLASDVSLWDKVVFRNLITFVVALLIALRSKSPLLGTRGNRRFLILRAILGLSGVTCYFYAIDNLLLADAATLNKVAPFVASILAAFVLRERLQRGVVGALIVAFIGTLLVVKPRFDVEMFPFVVALGSAFFAGSAYTVLRYLGARERPETIVLWFSAITVLGLGPISAASASSWTVQSAALLLCIGLAAALGQFALTSAYRFGPAAEVSLFGYATIVFSACLGWVFWSEVPDLWSFVGGVLIIGAGGWLIILAPPRPAMPSA
jgi:drug/metabolite transporter (DMT)-like permease